MLANHIKNIKPSATLSVTQKARDLKAMGKNILSLSAGEPDFITPDNICEAAITAMKSGKTKYTPVDGIIELKEAIIKKYEKQKGIKYDLNEVIVSVGAKQAIYNAFQATLNPGDEVIINSPYWVSYPDMVLLAKGSPLFVENIDSNGSLDISQIRKSITARTKWIVINFPNNPDGSIISKKDLHELSNILKENPHISLLSDDIYEDLIYEGESLNILQITPSLKDRVLIISGVSKSYAMTGWRIGYALGEKNLIKGIKTIQSQSTSGPCSISQYAAVEALKNSDDFIKFSREKFLIRRNLIVDLLSKSLNLSVVHPKGAFYVFVDARKCINRATPKGVVIKDDSDLCEYLLEEAGVAVVPGSAFGKKGFFRASYACSEEDIISGSSKIVEFCDILK